MADRVKILLLSVLGVSVGGLGSMALLGAGRAPEVLSGTASPIVCGTTRVIDGDTFDCGTVRIRLLAIDAPERIGGCRDRSNCPPMDGEESTAQLVFLLAAGDATCRPVGTDAYGRTLATCSAGGEDVSCAMIEAGAAAYVSRWDNGGLVASTCPAAR